MPGLKSRLYRLQNTLYEIVLKDARRHVLGLGVKLSLLAPEKVFLVVGLLVGTLVSYFYPPFAGPDELNHLRRAYQVSEGSILSERMGEYAGGYLPRSLLDAGLGVTSIRETGVSPDDSLSNVPGRAFIDFRNTVTYTPVPYLPNAAALAACRALGLSPRASLYPARLAGLAAGLACLWLAIRITPVAKWMFVALAFTPMSIRLTSVVTADTVTHASAFLLLAICLRLALAPEARPRGAILAGLFGAALILSLSKQAYLPMLLLYFLCPARKFGGRKQQIALFAVLAVLCVGAQAAWFLASWDLYVPQPLAPDADPVQQASFILHNPVRYAGILLKDLWRHKIFYPSGAFGYRGIVPQWISAPLALGLLLLALAGAGRSLTLDFKAKLLLAVTGVCTAVTVITMNYFGWNAVGASTITFVQGRYFIPVLPLGLLLASSLHWRFLWESSRVRLRRLW